MYVCFCRYTCTSPRALPHASVHTLVCMQLCMCARFCFRVHMHERTRIHAHIRTDRRTDGLTGVHVCIRACMHTRRQTDIPSRTSNLPELRCSLFPSLGSGVVLRELSGNLLLLVISRALCLPLHCCVAAFKRPGVAAVSRYGATSTSERENGVIILLLTCVSRHFDASKARY